MTEPRPGPPTLRTYRAGDETEIIAMLDATFGRRRTIEEWRWRYRDAPGGPALIHVLELDGRLVGHMAHLGFPVFVDGQRLRLGLGGGTLVLPEARGHTGMPKLVRGFLRSEHGFDLRINFPTDRAGVAMERLGGGRRLGRMPRWVRWRSAHAALPLPVRIAVASGAIRLYSSLASQPRPRLLAEPLTELGPEVDRLAQASAEFARCIRVRDAAYMRWRWLGRPGRSWTIRGVRDPQGELRGLVVFGTLDSQYGPLGVVADVLARDATTLRALLLDAADGLAATGCGMVTCDYLDPRPWARRALYRAGFLPIPDGANILCGSLSERAGPAPEQRESWYLTRGDTDLA